FSPPRKAPSASASSASRRRNGDGDRLSKTAPGSRLPLQAPRRIEPLQLPHRVHLDQWPPRCPQALAVALPVLRLHQQNPADHFPLDAVPVAGERADAILLEQRAP